jgi:cytosine/adenosine deaminase-related metal-dependent hydrolase
MATIDGARTLGLEHEIGSIEVGKKADLIVLGLKPPAPVTAENLSYQIVAQAQGSDVETVIVDGAVLMEDGKVLSAEEEEVYPQSIKSIYEIWRRGKLI